MAPLHRPWVDVMAAVGRMAGAAAAQLRRPSAAGAELLAAEVGGVVMGGRVWGCCVCCSLLLQCRSRRDSRGHVISSQTTHPHTHKPPNPLDQIETLETLRLRLRGAFLAVRRARHAKVRASRGEFISAEQEAGAQDSVVFFAWQVGALVCWLVGWVWCVWCFWLVGAWVGSDDAGW
jgi:hypothetical protein